MLVLQFTKESTRAFQYFICFYCQKHNPNFFDFILPEIKLS